MVDLDPRRLSLLLDLARRGSVTAVAHERHLTPTAVSQQLKLLEREAGASLVVRVGRGVELTEAGLALADAAAELELARARVAATWDGYHHRVAGTVSLSVYPTGGQALLPGLLHRLAAHPDLTLRVSEADMVGDDYVDLADDVDVVLGHRASVDDTWADVVAASASTGRALELVELASEPLDVAAAPGHRLAGLAEVTVADVVEESWVGVPVGWPFDRALGAWFAAAGHVPLVRHRFTDLRLQEALVAGGHGIALLPRQSTAARDDRLVLRPVLGSSAGPAPLRRIAALARADRAVRVAVRAVLDAMREEASCVPGWVPVTRGDLVGPGDGTRPRRRGVGAS